MAQAKARNPWMLPLGLALLVLMPLTPGFLRLWELSGGPQLMPENPAVLAAPLPVVIHIVSVAVFYLFGAMQLSSGLRNRYPGLHKLIGRKILPFGFAVALSGLWMSAFYPHGPLHHDLLTAFRLMAGTGMAVSLGLGVQAILNRDIASHRAWMIRAYAIGLGAVTQMIVGIPVLLTMELNGFSNALLMGLGWGINVVIAEVIIRRPKLVVRKRFVAAE